METRLSVFEGIEIRKTFIVDEWWFSVIDVVALLTESTNPRDYWYRMKKRVFDESSIELSTNCRQLKLKASSAHFKSRSDLDRP